ncbi:MAG: hypothetical protein ACRD12_09010 [Acidimicrobiales bacterium]
MSVLAGAVAGCVAGALTWWAVRGWFTQPSLLRSNYRDHPVPTAAGVVLALALLEVEALRAVAGAPTLSRFVTVFTVAGFCLVGTVDDLAGAGDDRGFRGHLRALRSGRVTTGVLKLVGGALVAVVAVAPVSGGGTAQLLADAALVALCANLANLLDRGPGRVTKVSLVAFVVLAVASRADPELAGVAVVAGGAAALLVDDLRERLMLGDAGANPLGAALGLGVVLVAPPLARNLVLVAVALLNVAGEAVSFSRVIEAVPPLRALDRAGRRPTWRPSS